MKMLFVTMLMLMGIGIVYSQSLSIKNFESSRKNANNDSDKYKAIFSDYHQKHSGFVKNNIYTLDSLITGKYDYYETYQNKKIIIYYYDEFGFNTEYVSKIWSTDQLWQIQSKITYTVFLDSLEIVLYAWDNSANEWNSSWRDVYVYDENNQETEYREYFHNSIDSEIWVLRSLRTKVYNENLQIILKEYFYRYDDSEPFLSLNSKDVYFYDTENRLSRIEFLQFDFENSQWNYIQKEVNTYDDFSNLILIDRYYFDIEQDEWIGPGTKIEYSFDIYGNKLLETESYYYIETSTWDIAQKFTWTYDTETPSFSKIDYYVEEDNDQPAERYDANCDVSGILLNEFYYYYENDAWQPSIKTENIYDLSSNVETYNHYNWDWITMSWKKVIYNDRDYNHEISVDMLAYPSYTGYNALFTGLINSDIKYNLTESQFKPDEKISFFWSGIDNLGVNDQILSSINLYPNPCNSLINFSFTNPAQTAIFALFDMQGRSIISQTVNSNTGISISELSSGLYMYKITNGTDVYTGKLIKE